MTAWLLREIADQVTFSVFEKGLLTNPPAEERRTTATRTRRTSTNREPGYYKKLVDGQCEDLPRAYRSQRLGNPLIQLP